MRIKFFYPIIALLCFVVMELNAQQLPLGQYFEGSFHVGRIFKHTSKIVIPLSQIRPTYGGELSWEMQTYGKQYWNRPSRFPRMGAALSFQDFGDARLGWGLGVMPFLNLRIFKIGPVEMFGRLAMGVSYVSKHWDGYYNPMNNIIGSHLNNNTGIRFGFSISALRQFEFRPSFSFTHYSNGASQFPNLGINVMSFHLGVLYKNNPLKPDDFIRDGEVPKRHKLPRISLSTGMGLKEVGRTYRGPKYAVMVTNVDVGLFTGPTNILKLGITHEYNQSDYAFSMQSGAVSKAEAAKAAHRLLYYIEDEVLFGRVSFSGQIGYYFTKAPVPLPFTRLSLRYYPFDPIKNKWAPYLGVRLKAHGITAEYFDIQIGVALK